MQGQIYFHLLILCGIWFLGIIGTFANEEIKESSDFLDRHKRVVSHVPGEDSTVKISNVKYVVIIKHLSRITCVGSILSLNVVITAAQCVERNQDQYKIVSSTSSSNRGNPHNVIDIRRHFAIALLTTDQPFIYGAFCHNIQLHQVPLLPGTVAQISGWGYNWRGAERGTNHPITLRSIEVPIMAHQNCANIYRPHQIAITDKEICTYHEQRHSGHTDFGAGLVVDGYLAGVFLWSGLNQSSTDSQYPDVFGNLQHPEYSNWIRSNLQDIYRRQSVWGH